MATRKKAKKAKAKPKRRKVAAKRPAGRKQPVRRKPPVKAAKKPARKTPVRPKPARPASPPPAPPPGERLGVVTHYYSHLSVAVVKLDPGTSLRVGDNIHIKGHTSDFGQRVESLQVGHAPVEQVGPDDDFGLQVREHAREHDVVYRVK